MRGALGVCPGVATLFGERVTATGTVLVDGEQMYRPRCLTRAALAGAETYTDFSRKITLLIQGTLRGDNVVDRLNNRSSKVIRAYEERLAGRHVHIVDAAGFGQLLDRQPAPCLRSVPVGEELHLSRAETPTAVAGAAVDVADEHPAIFGGRSAARAVPTHPAAHLELDLSALDRGTAAHEATVEKLCRFLASRGITARTPAPGMPPFDLGWTEPDDGRAVIAEVKSVSDTNETQQLRLAVGQVLDYVDSIRRRVGPDGPQVTPTIVLEREPTDARWSGLAADAGITLTWAPDFPFPDQPESRRR